MGDEALSRGPHTWPIVHAYHKCEKCGKVIESRASYVYRLGQYEKELDCPRCQHHFVERRQVKAALGPLWNQ